MQKMSMKTYFEFISYEPSSEAEEQVKAMWLSMFAKPEDKGFIELSQKED